MKNKVTLPLFPFFCLLILSCGNEGTKTIDTSSTENFEELTELEKAIEFEFQEIPAFDDFEEERNFFSKFTNPQLIDEIEKRCNHAETEDIYSFNLDAFYGEAIRRFTDNWDEKLARAMLSCIGRFDESSSAINNAVFILGIDHLAFQYPEQYPELLQEVFSETKLKEYLESVDDFNSEGNY